MKSLKSIIATAACALACASVAQATVVVHFTGSTAYRGAFTNAILHSMTSGSAAWIGKDNTVALNGATTAIFRGLIGGTDTIIKTSFNGSVGGILTVTKNVALNFLDTTATPMAAVSIAAGNVITGGTYIGTAGTYEVVAPEVAMSDVYQGSTAYKTPTLTTDKIVGIVPFQWVVSADGTNSISNMTPQLAQSQWGGFGTLPLSLYTGNPADSVTTVYATGRDNDSGTRLTAFAESGVGVASSIQQYDPSTGNPYPAQTLYGIDFMDVGQGGESSGGTLAGKMGAHSGTIYVSYFSTGDATTAAGVGAKKLTYNGFAYSAAAVAEGQYTFWGYEHLMYKTTDAGIKGAANKIADQLTTTDGTVLVGSMHVSRASDGGVVINN